QSTCLRILEAVEAVNDDQKQRLASKLRQALGDDLSGARIAVWGLALKPNTDDMRDSPSLALIDKLLKAGAQIAAHDPVAMDEAKHRFNGKQGITFADTSYDALSNAD